MFGGKITEYLWLIILFLVILAVVLGVILIGIKPKMEDIVKVIGV